MIRANGLKKAFKLQNGKSHVALEGIDFRVNDGELVALLGPSGCGKTTLLNILSGLDRPSAGEIQFVGARRKTPTKRPPTGHVFQDARLLPWLSVRENIRFVLDEGDSAERADEWLTRVGLSEYGYRYPGQLSIGMQQRVAVARALAIEPEVLLMDEPFSSLDELTGRHMRDELLRLWRSIGCTILFVTHNPQEAIYLSDRVLVMTPGPGRIRSEVNLQEAFPRPRSPRDPRIWEYAGQAVELLSESERTITKGGESHVDQARVQGGRHGG